MLNKHPFNKAYLVTVFMVFFSFSMDRISIPPDIDCTGWWIFDDVRI